MNLDAPEIERLLSALERIALALELATGLERPDVHHIEDESAVFYHNDLEALQEEIKREKYRRRGGRPVAQGDPLPSHGSPDVEFEP